VQLVALDLNTNFAKTAVFCEVRRRSEPNLIILPPLLERYFYTQKQKGRTTMELKDTVALMESADFKDRFKGEYYQTKIRYEKLHAMIVKYEAGTLNFEPKCSIELLKEQSAAMGKYLYMLEVRATIEGVEL
jgi:hypothetical protein